MKKFLSITLLIIAFCNISIARTYLNLKGDVLSESNFVDYFNENMLELDPIEGIYIFSRDWIQNSPTLGPKVQTIDATIALVSEGNGIFASYVIDEKGMDNSFIIHKAAGNSYDYDYGYATGVWKKQKFIFNGTSFSFHFSFSELEKSLIFNGAGRLVKAGVKDKYVKTFPTENDYANAQKKRKESKKNQNLEWSGTAFALKNNYIVTNYHVVENANEIFIQGINGNFNNKYNATVIASDKFNDLAILKVQGITITSANIPYSIKTSTSDVGEDVFVLGYPLTATMGDEVKLTTGVVSSKTGFQGDVSQYQISAPVQPGNSGGPLFDSKGNVIGIISAKHRDTENVSYSIKASYLRNLMESTISSNILPQNNKISGMNLSGKVKAVKNYVYYITCYSTGNENKSYGGNSYSGNSTYSSSTGKNFSCPSVNRNLSDNLKVVSVSLQANQTVITLSDNNITKDGMIYSWLSLDKSTYIVANGQRYTLKHAEGIALSPDKTYFSYAGETKTFTLYFPPIPQSTTSIDLIESDSSEWKMYGIQLR